MRSFLRSARTVAWMSLFSLTAGCADRTTVGGSHPDSGPSAPGTERPALSRAGSDDSDLYRKLESQINDIINEQTLKYMPLQYKYTENLLEIIDQIDQSLSGKAKGEPPRFLPKLDASEELAHFRETVRRWQARTGKNVRTEVDALKAEVAARKPGERFHPEFQRKFSQVFDDFIAIEVAELRERRNRAIHAAADKLLAPYLDKNPGVVHQLQMILDVPPYDVPPSAGAGLESSTHAEPSR
jgi:hypothetical protein